MGLLSPNALAAAVLLFATAPLAYASSAIVPDQFATIQLAINSGADSVLVRPGTYEESPIANRGLVVASLLPPLGGPVNMTPPIVRGFTIAPEKSGDLWLIGFRVTGPIVTTYDHGLDGFRDCRLDTALTMRADRVALEGCLVFGGIRMICTIFDIGMCTVIGGTVSAEPISTSSIHDCAILGPAALGIECRNDTYVGNNYLRGCVTGIRVGSDSNGGIVDNTVEDCSGVGYLFASGLHGGPAGFSGNVARRTGSQGFEIPGSISTIQDCVAEDTGAEGFHCLGDIGVIRCTVRRSHGAGIVAGSTHVLQDNTVINTGGDGLVVGAVRNGMSGNVVGRCAGRGFVLTVDTYPPMIRNNTAYLNGGSGFDLTSVSAQGPDSLFNNIAYGNARGLVWSGSVAPVLGCNDWFGNTSGAVVGAFLGASDLAVNPLFCDLPNDLVTLSSGSPLANPAGCGLVGARPVGCSLAVSVPPVHTSALGVLRVSPQPSNAATRFAWGPGSGSVELAVYDVTGARRWRRSVEPTASEFVWNGADDSGQRLPAGVYFARVTRGTERSDATVVVVR